MNSDTVRIATIPWKLIRISSTTTIKSQTHRTNQHEQDITIHNAGFTEANLRGQLKKKRTYKWKFSKRNIQTTNAFCGILQLYGRSNKKAY